ncbi:MAG: adenylate/guanylate cyclase domain-containing protein, partial [Rudaea sp.]
MKCWNCGFENPPNVKFCNNCGSPQQRPCPLCGTTNPPGSKFCNNCGLNLQEAYVAPASSPASPGPASAPSTAQDLIARYMPQDLADKIKEAGSRGGVEGERRIATILFCDVKGSTAMAETLDPEEWADIMNRAFRYLIEPVYRYEGTVARLMGDAILAFFGAPIAHEDDPYRAVLASLDILHGIDDYRDRVRRDNGLDFSVRIGLNTGLVVVGNVGSDLKYEYTAMGDAINLASRLQAAAEPDSVLISENTYHQVAQLVDVIDKGKVQIKGKAEPVRVYQVTAARQGVARTRGLAGLTSPMVDRRREFAALMQTLDDLRAGRGSIVSVIGEAGLGKSRLIAEWHKAVDLHGGDWPIRWVEGRCLSYGASMAHHLSMDILRNLIGAPAGATEEDTRSALRASLDRGMETDTDDAYAYLA